MPPNPPPPAGARRASPLLLRLVVAASVATMLGSAPLVVRESRRRSSVRDGGRALVASFAAAAAADAVHDEVDAPAAAAAASPPQGASAPRRPAAAPPSSRELAVRDSPAGRHAYWWRCLDAADDGCRPEPEAAYTVLPFAEWLKYTEALANATAALRDLPQHTYAHPRYPRAAHAGPWLENAFIAHFLDGGRAESFYPLVPLFVPWTDAAHGDAAAAAAALRVVSGGGGEAPLLRRDVLHVALMQYDRVPRDRRPSCAALRNVVVLSAAGWGSVPVPLVKGETPPHSATLGDDADPVNNYVRRFVLAFVGDDATAGRRRVVRDVVAASRSLPSDDWAMYFGGEPWTWLTHAALFVATPRGRNRATFQTADVLQYGRVPLVIHERRGAPAGAAAAGAGAAPWVPYQHPLDLVAPGDVPPRFAAGGANDAAEFGAVLQRLPVDGSPTAGPAGGDDDGAPPGPSTWSSILNRGGVWGPGGLGFAFAADELPAFLCVACDFVRPGSAARWRRVRALPLHAYGVGPARACPCTPAVWEAATTESMGPRGNWTLPPTSLLYEMERRVQAVGRGLFTIAGAIERVQHFVSNPVGRGGDGGGGGGGGLADTLPALHCVPRPAEYDPLAATAEVANAAATDGAAPQSLGPTGGSAAATGAGESGRDSAHEPGGGHELARAHPPRSGHRGARAGRSGRRRQGSL